MTIQEIEECFEVEVGAPTLTLILKNEQRMIGYAGFRDAVCNDGRITIRFRDWQVTIVGQNLKLLWKQMQMQDVRVIRVCKNVPEGDCLVTQIQIEEIEQPF